MDIKPSINLPGQAAPTTSPTDTRLNLKVGQTLDATVVGAVIKAEENAIALKLGGKLITLQSSQPVELDPGQPLRIQVSKTTPVLEFKIVDAALQPKLQTALLSLQAKPASAPPLEPDTAFVLKQQLLAKITGLVGDKIELQVLSSQPAPQNQDKAAETLKQSILITIERSQLQTAPAQPLKAAEPLQLGQWLKLEVTRAGLAPTFRMWPVEGAGSAEKITELLKQFLPRHQSAPVLLNQLIKDLPQLIRHESLPQALKDRVLTILQNLPQKQQLLTGPGIKQATNASGLFLEARLGQLTATSPSALAEEVQMDFKANLLKLVRLLQPAVSAPAVNNQQDVELALLKNLQQKTENTIARIVLDQLLSLPKDDHPKQVWHLELPFMDRENTETVNLEIRQDKDADGRHPDSGNWSVNITLTPPGLGTIHCALSYRDQKINTHFRSRESQTTELIKHHLDYLKAQFEQSGLSTGHIQAQDEPQKTKPAHPPTEAKLFDDKA